MSVSRPTPVASEIVAAPSIGSSTDDAPKDCVRQFPTLSPDVVQLVPFDSRGVARLRVEVSISEDLEEWERWLLRWVRRRHPSARGDMRVIR
jgi:hypothetical protein